MGRSPYHGPQLSFSPANTKLAKTADKLNVKPTEYWALDLRAGITCPYAKECKSIATDNGIVDGPHCQFRCYAATAENRLPCIKALRDRNTKTIKSIVRNHRKNKIADLLQSNLPHKCKVIRIHTSGELFNYRYLEGWLELAKRRQDIRFYFYTKALPLIQRYVQTHPEGVHLPLGILAPNVRITASYGGTHDHLIDELGIRSVKVVLSENETNLPIDDDDTHAALSGPSFALVVHATQPIGSKAAKAWEKIRRKTALKNKKGG